MCAFSPPEPPKQDVLEPPPQYAQQRSPDGDAARTSTSRRVLDRMRAGAATVLTSGSGVTSAAPVGTKTLLGQ